MNRIATIQLTSSQHVPENLSLVAELITTAAEEGAKMVFLPENFAALANPDVFQIALRESSAEGPIRSFLAAQARTNEVWIVAGTVPVSTRPDGFSVPDERVRAASLVYDQSGIEVARYDKIHMFDVNVNDNQKHYMESQDFEAGTELVVIDTPVGRLGLSVCYDIRFPEMYRALLHKGAQIISVPSAFTRITGEAHWQILTRSRAIENACYIVAACQYGNHDSGRQTWGESIVVDPWGRILNIQSDGSGVGFAEIDLTLLKSIRSDMPLVAQCRFDVVAEFP
ncbi:MAG: carbon-nitrogen hydrolase family protein [Gammaproteobacteria bacterium]|nr:carbon-nitrogen hydrolase family protein [Gammaproteobacteria bacterium]